MISPSDPSSAWTAKANKRVQFGYGLNYLVDVEHAVIVDVEATPARTYDEVEAMARAGAKVLHWKAVAPARAAGVPIVVRNTFRPLSAGTWIGVSTRRKSVSRGSPRGRAAKRNCRFALPAKQASHCIQSGIFLPVGLNLSRSSVT